MHAPSTAMTDVHPFADHERAAVYRAIHARRDVRSQFLPDPVDDAVLARLLHAAHHAPSVGFMQPWSFIVVRSRDRKREVKAAFERANGEAAALFEGERRTLYSRFKLEGIEEAPINLCVTCDRERAGPVVLGRTHDPAMDLYSTVCAVQNLWLAATAEGLGVGWMSIVRPEDLRAILGIPEAIVPVAYLCIGHVRERYRMPELEAKGWRKRLDLATLVHRDRWGGELEPGERAALEDQTQRACISQADPVCLEVPGTT